MFGNLRRTRNTSNSWQSVYHSFNCCSYFDLFYCIKFSDVVITRGEGLFVKNMYHISARSIEIDSYLWYWKFFDIGNKNNNESDNFLTSIVSLCPVKVASWLPMCCLCECTLLIGHLIVHIIVNACHFTLQGRNPRPTFLHIPGRNEPLTCLLMNILEM